MTIIETASSISCYGNVPSFPMQRECPFHPPTGLNALRTAGPVSRVALFSARIVWVVTGHAEARALLTDPCVSADRTNPSFPMQTPSSEATRSLRTFAKMDPPHHTMHRRMLAASFTARRAAEMRPAIQRIINELVDQMLDQGPPVDLVSAFARPLPAQIMCELLGVPYDDHEYFHLLLRERVAENVEVAAHAQEKLVAYLAEQVHAKYAKPADDLISHLIDSQVRAGHLTHQQLVDMAVLLLIAGNETTIHMISLGVFTLLQHPDQLTVLLTAQDASTAVHELLRYLSVVDDSARVATADIEIGGRVIRAGDGIIFPTSAPNRDPRAFAAPDVLDLTRLSNNHLAFGYGVHRCLGQHLAMVELELAFSTLFTRIPTLRLDGHLQDVVSNPASEVQGVRKLPVAW